MKTFILLGLILLAPSAAWAGNTDLSPKEKEALRLAAQWSDKPIKPIKSVDGKVMFVHGATRPTIIGTPMQISDIELEAGEVVNEILVGDTTRWLVESGSSRGGVNHVFVKPLDSGLETTLIITTNRRVYHLRLVSKDKDFMPYTGFLYPEQGKIIAAQERRKDFWASGTDMLTQGKVDLADLDFGYKVSGRAAWKPVQVYNDGRQTFVKLPDSAHSKDIPVLLALRGHREQLVNYRVQNGAYVVDGLFDHLVLINGVGRDRQRVDIERKIK